MKENSFLERLRVLISKLHVTDSEFAKAGGVSKSTFSNYINGNSQPKQEALTLWVQKYGLNANWILTGEGEMFLEEGAKAQPEAPKEDAPVTDPIAQRIETTAKWLEKIGAPPEKIQDAIMKILETSNETHTQADTTTLDAPAFADKCERSMKRT